jgi:hypothetical protein
LNGSRRLSESELEFGKVPDQSSTRLPPWKFDELWYVNSQTGAPLKKLFPVAIAGLN